MTEDQELEKLLELSAERYQQTEDIRKKVMAQLRKDERRRRWKKWLRPVCFAFGVPSLCVIFALLLQIGCKQKGVWDCNAVTIIPISVMIISIVGIVSHFQPFKK